MIYEGRGAVRWGRKGRRHPYRSGDPSDRARAIGLAHSDGLRRSARWLAADTGPGRYDAAPRAKRGAVPTAQERLYEQMLLQRVRLVEGLVSSMVLPLLTETRVDAAQLDPRSMARALGVVRAVRSVLGTLGMGDADGVEFIGQAIDERVTTSTDRDLSRLFNIPIATAAPSDAVAGWVGVNAQLITSIPTQYLDEISSLIEKGVRDGAQIRGLRDAIRSRYGVTRSRASLIARDQTAKLTGAIQRRRHQTYGITEYFWSSSGDTKVRQSHAALDGTRQSYLEPPVADDSGTRGHPGELWQCRCSARPIRPQDDAAELKAAATARKEREAQILNQSPTVQGKIENRSGFTDWNRERLENLRSGGKRARQAVGL